MKCMHPLYAGVIKKKLKDGSIQKKIEIWPKSRKTEVGSRDYELEFKDFQNMFGYGKKYDECIQIPCGKCIGCKLTYSANWANRCMLEMKSQVVGTENWFITLTYNDANLPYKECINNSKSEKVSKATLEPRHLQLFMKRLRRRFPNNTVRFFACGEYGETNQRPHYHIILFDCPLSHGLEYKYSKNGAEYFISRDIEEIWSDGLTGDSFGYNIVTGVTWDTCAYVARYVLKKAKGDFYYNYADKNHIEREFIRMSRRPGIARLYYDEHQDEIYSRDTISEGFKSPIKPPKYYDRLYDINHHDILEIIKDKRKDKIKHRPKPATDLSESEYNLLLERSQIQVCHRLPRDIETL